MIYYYNAHKKPSSKFHYSFELYSSVRCPFPLYGQSQPPSSTSGVVYTLRDFSLFSHKRVSGLGGLTMGGCPVYASVFLSNAAFRDALQAAVSRNTGAHQWVFITSVQHYKATVAQSCTTFSANSEPSYFQQARGGRVLFFRASWALRGGKSHTHFGSIPILSLL